MDWLKKWYEEKSLFDKLIIAAFLVIAVSITYDAYFGEPIDLYTNNKYHYSIKTPHMRLVGGADTDKTVFGWSCSKGPRKRKTYWISKYVRLGIFVEELKSETKNIDTSDERQIELGKEFLSSFDGYKHEIRDSRLITLQDGIRAYYTTLKYEMKDKEEYVYATIFQRHCKKYVVLMSINAFNYDYGGKRFDDYPFIIQYKEIIESFKDMEL